jgi:hypothetical protein
LPDEVAELPSRIVLRGGSACPCYARRFPLWVRKMLGLGVVGSALLKLSLLAGVDIMVDEEGDATHTLDTAPRSPYRMRCTSGHSNPVEQWQKIVIS